METALAVWTIFNRVNLFKSSDIHGNIPSVNSRKNVSQIITDFSSIALIEKFSVTEGKNHIDKIS